MSNEYWKLIPSVPEILASSFGRLMVVPFLGLMPNGGHRHYGGDPNIGQWDGDRYIYVVKCKTAKTYKTYKVARLVCEAFNGPPPEGKNVCMHLDENSRNNRPSNLKWGTQKENLNAFGFLKYCRGRIGENSPTVKFRSRRTA